ncbi:MAG: glycosyltransferase [Thermoleophilaceae bacterium]
MGRRILVVTYFHPPFPGGGGARWVALAKHLRRAGHEVGVITTSAHGSLPEDDGEGTVRTADMAASGGLRRLLRRPALPERGAPGGAGANAKPPPTLLTRTLVPDPHVVSWAPLALAAARRAIRVSGGVDCLVTSGPPESTHLVGLALRRSVGAWMADFRDGWSYEPLRDPFPAAAQRRLDLSLERRVALRADAVLGATEPIARDLAERLGANAVHVPNGWDPDLEEQVARAEPPPLEEGVVNLVHTGTMSGGWGRDPRPLFDALRQAGGRIRLVLAGRLDTEEERLIRAPGLEGVVKHVGSLGRFEAIALQRRADALVLVTSRNASEATGKLFEYLASGRPVIALAEGNEAARIVRDTGAGVTVAPDDTQAIAEVLRAAERGELPYEPRGLDAYAYPAPADAVAELMERVLAR